MTKLQCMKILTCDMFCLIVFLFRMNDDDYDDYGQFYDSPPATQNSKCKECLNWITLRWLKTPIGLLKVMQFGTLLMSLIVIGAVTDGHRTSMEFFIFTATAGWVFVLITILLYILDVYSKLPEILRSDLTMLIACGKKMNKKIILISHREKID